MRWKQIAYAGGGKGRPRPLQLDQQPYAGGKGRPRFTSTPGEGLRPFEP